MRKIILGLVILACAIGASAQKISLRATGQGKVSVAKGGLRSAINLSRDIARCAGLSGVSKREADKRGCTAPPADFRLVDATVKNGQTFLVVQAAAMGNCNVCGQCGASESFTLIWLKMDSRLRVLKKQIAIVQSCLENISIVGDEVAIDENTQDETLNLKFEADVLTLEFEKQDYDGKSGMTNYESSRLKYDRKTPDRGFIIDTQKRAV